MIIFNRIFTTLLAVSILCTSSLCQSAHGFEEVLEDYEAIESIQQVGNGFVLTVVDDPSKAEMLPQRRYIVLNDSLGVVLDSVLDQPFRLKKKDQVVYSNSLIDFFYDYRYGTFGLNKITIDSITQATGQLPRKIYNPTAVLNHNFVYIADETPNKERIIRQSLIASETTTTDVSRIKKRTRVTGLFFDTIPNSREVCYIWNERSKKVDDVYVKIWNDENEESVKFQIAIDGKSIQKVSITKIDDGEYILSGTYGKMNSTKSSGAFIAFADEGSIIKSNIYSFSDLTHYFDYMDVYQKEDMKRKLARLKKFEKSTDILVQTIPHNLIDVEDAWLLPIEIVVPKYTDLYGISRNGNQVVGTPRERVGYDYTHSTILRFDKSGELIHDYFVPFYLKYLPEKEKPQLQYTVNRDTLVLGYAARHSFYFGDIKPLSFESLSSDTLRPEINDNVTRIEKRFFFIDSNTIVEYGYKTIKGDGILPKRREVFYMEKRKLH